MDAAATGGAAAPQITDSKGISYVALEQCESLIATWMLEMKSSLARDDMHVLLRAFQALDPDNRLAAALCALQYLAADLHSCAADVVVGAQRGGLCQAESSWEASQLVLK